MSISSIKKLMESSLNEISVPSKNNLISRDFYSKQGRAVPPVQINKLNKNNYHSGGARTEIEFIAHPNEVKYNLDFLNEKIDFVVNINKSKITDLKTNFSRNVDKTGVLTISLSIKNLLNNFFKYAENKKIHYKEIEKILSDPEKYLQDNKYDIGYMPTYIISLIKSREIISKKGRIQEKLYFGSIKTNSLKINNDEEYEVNEGRNSTKVKFIKNDSPEKFEISGKYTITPIENSEDTSQELVYVSDINEIDNYESDTIGSVLYNLLIDCDDYIKNFIDYFFNTTSEIIEISDNMRELKFYSTATIYLNDDYKFIDYNNETSEFDILSSNFEINQSYYLLDNKYKKEFIEKLVRSKFDSFSIKFDDNNDDKTFEFEIFLNNKENSLDINSLISDGNYFKIDDITKIKINSSTLDVSKNLYRSTVDVQIDINSENSSFSEFESKISESLEKLLKILNTKKDTNSMNDAAEKFIILLKDNIDCITTINFSEKDNNFIINASLDFNSNIKFDETTVDGNSYVFFDKDKNLYIGIILRNAILEKLLSSIKRDILFLKGMNEDNLNLLKNENIQILTHENERKIEVIDSELKDNIRYVKFVEHEKTGNKEENIPISVDTDFGSLINFINKKFTENDKDNTKEILPLTRKKFYEILEITKEKLSNKYKNIKTNYRIFGSGSNATLKDSSILVELNDDFDKSFEYYREFDSFSITVHTGILTISLKNDGFNEEEFQSSLNEIFKDNNMIKESIPLDEAEEEILLEFKGFKFNGSEDIEIETVKVSLNTLGGNGMIIKNPGYFKLDTDSIKENILNNYDKNNYSEIDLDFNSIKVYDDSDFSSIIYSYDPSFDNIIIENGKFEIPYTIHNNDEDKDESGIAYSNEYYFKESKEFKEKMTEYMKAVKLVIG